MIGNPVSEVQAKNKLHRPYFYGYGNGSTIHAYTKEEWGIGAPLPGGNYATHSVALLTFAVIVMIPATLGATFITVVLAVHLSWVALIALFFSLLFGMGTLMSITTIKNEMKARGLRRAKGIPKPRLIASDEEARRWFMKNPSPLVPVTSDSFPLAKW